MRTDAWASRGGILLSASVSGAKGFPSRRSTRTATPTPMRSAPVGMDFGACFQVKYRSGQTLSLTLGLADFLTLRTRSIIVQEQGRGFPFPGCCSSGSTGGMPRCLSGIEPAAKTRGGRDGEKRLEETRCRPEHCRVDRRGRSDNDRVHRRLKRDQKRRCR